MVTDADDENAVRLGPRSPHGAVLDDGRPGQGRIPDAAKPEDEAAFLEQLVAERRVVVRLKVGRLYGTALDID
ncbi:hypothetical protein AMK31_30690 [Streptomyces sp. TSRI0107]|nr:hypothetical protein AMK31_30690 [Streptomyces sp. TSRI0107]